MACTVSFVDVELMSPGDSGEDELGILPSVSVNAILAMTSCIGKCHTDLFIKSAIFFCVHCMVTVHVCVIVYGPPKRTLGGSRISITDQLAC